MPRQSKRTRDQDDALDAPIVEVFGGTLALLIIVFVLVNLISSQDIQAMLEHSTEGAKYKVSWQDGSEGLVIVTYPDKLIILENNKHVPRDAICDPGGPFLAYVASIYDNPTQQQIIFAITSNSVTTMAIARECMRLRYVDRHISIGWIIASADLLSTVRLNQLPDRIKRTIK